MIGWWPKSPGGGDHDHPARRHKTDPHQPMLREIGGIGQEIKREETEQDAERCWVTLADKREDRFKELSVVDPLPGDAQVSTRRATLCRLPQCSETSGTARRTRVRSL